jgi:hypothetical protein
LPNTRLPCPHSLPISIGGGIIFILIGYLPPTKFPLKIRMVVGALVGMVGTILLIFGQGKFRGVRSKEHWLMVGADQKDYWRFVATGFFIGSIGTFASEGEGLMLTIV